MQAASTPKLSSTGQEVIDGIARRHGFGVDATLSMLDSMVRGNGGMAQFDHPEFGGSGQWMRGGMTMVSDMFNSDLKGRVERLCADLAEVLAEQPGLMPSGSFQSQGQGGGFGGERSGDPHQTGRGDGGRQLERVGTLGAASLFASDTSRDWWPSALGRADSAGAQNEARYAYFAGPRRLAIDVGGKVTVYDTLDHRIGGFSQQQSGSGTLSFNSQHGLVDVARLPVVSTDEQPSRPQASSPATAPEPAPESHASDPRGHEPDVLTLIEKLADLHAKGILSEAEFVAKKAELLRRL